LRFFEANLGPPPFFPAGFADFGAISDLNESLVWA
jgi:hypothetical protein